MSNIHDPVQQLRVLRQVLSQDKRPLGLFLGAGCPVAIRVAGDRALIPDIRGLTQMVLEEGGRGNCRREFEIVADLFVKDGRNNPTIEDYLTHIRGLKAIVGLGEARGLELSCLEQLEREICDLIRKAVDVPLPEEHTPYQDVVAWIRSIARTDPVEIFTPNYDLLAEQALEEGEVPYFDGFIGVREPFFDLTAIETECLPPRWARLWKLHGSINWRMDESSHRVTRGGRMRAAGGEPEPGSLMIHPSHLKYDETRKMPYLAMLDRLSHFLRKPGAVLVVCGYSFSDHHLNQVIRQSLGGNPQGAAFALCFGPLASAAPARDFAATRSNVTVLAKDGAVVGTRSGSWTIPRDDEEARLFSPALKVKESDDKRSYEMTIGDFVSFGEFLTDSIGALRSSVSTAEPYVA